MKPLKLKFPPAGANEITRDEEIDMNRFNYAGGYALYAYNLTLDLA
jgi:hypothetical protein